MESAVDYESILNGIDERNLLQRLSSIEKISLCKWKLDSPYADFVYINEQDILIIKLDLIPDNVDWLIDEELFNDETPLYFSESGHRVSPVYKMRRAVHELSEPKYNVYSLLISTSNYINIEDYLAVWKKYNVSVVHRAGFRRTSLPSMLCSDSLSYTVFDSEKNLKAEELKLELEDRINKIKSWEDSDERWGQDDDVMEIDTNSEYNANFMDDMGDDGDWFDYDDDYESAGIKLDKIKFAYVKEGDEPTEYTNMRYFHWRKKHRMWMKISWHDIEYQSDENDDLNFTFEVHEVAKPTCRFIKRYSTTCKRETLQKECVLCLDAIDKEAEYSLVIKANGRLLELMSLFIADVPLSYTDCFDVETFQLYRENIDGDDSYEDIIVSTKPLTMFNEEDLKTVVIALLLKTKLKREWWPSLVICLYNEAGNLVRTTPAEVQEVEAERKSFIQLVGSVGELIAWKTGRYHIEIKFMEERVISAYFDVASKDIEGKFSLTAITCIPEKTHKKTNTLSMDNGSAINKLDRMIGLQGVKRQIKLYKETVEFIRKRKRQGLYGEYPPLHALFLGNPGTGKTSVARLLGDVMKELGLLSKGHIIYEERNTLLGPHYSNEEEKTLRAIERAQGGILFIDEAYNLYKPDDPKDPGKCVLETLITSLSDESKNDWMLLMAGYTEPMLAMLNCNPGLDSRFPPQNRYYFDDYTVEELMEIADLYFHENNYRITSEARAALRMRVTRDYKMRDDRFGNARYIKNLLTRDVMYAMSTRVNKLPNPTVEQLVTIEKEDIPQYKLKDYRTPLKKLQDLIGLSRLKKSVEGHLNMVQLNLIRAEQGIPTEMPPLHMAFVGNPGTGKTMVADLMGEIYASMGLLSVGKVMKVERKDLVGQHIGETEKKTAELLLRARGHVLFIDEAYTLCDNSESKNDFGRRALEVLLTTLSREQIDMIVIFAGYPQQMNELFQMNPGLRSRIPYTFYFEDYSVDELLEIAREVVKKKHFYFSPAAFKVLRSLVEKQLQKKDAMWGNARFITRLIASHIIPAMSNRLKLLAPHKLQNKKTLQMICKSDIPLNIDGLYQETFDEVAVRRALKKLDSLVGLQQVKKAIHNLVDVSRYMYQHGQAYSTGEPLRWTFTGNTGTGKSTVAGILAELLKAMNYLGSGQLVEIKAEELCGIPEYKVDELLKSAMKRACNGLLFIDGDAPIFGQADSRFNSEALRFKISSLLVDMPGTYALVIGELAPRTPTLTGSLLFEGVPSFDRTFHFADYTGEELLQILEMSLKKRKLRMDEEAYRHIATYINGLCSQRELGYANARTMKLISDSITESYVVRIGKTDESATKDIVILQDVACFVWKKKNTKIGF